MNGTKTIHERIAFLVDRFGKGRNTVFASLIGSSEGNIRGYINKGVTPKQDVLERIVRMLGVNAGWLLTGEGPVLIESPAPTGGQANVVREGWDMVSIPMVEMDIAAGISDDDNPGYFGATDKIDMPCNMLCRGCSYYCIRVQGESMAPTMLDSDYLIVRLLDRSEWQDLADKQVCVISTVQGYAYVRRIKNRLEAQEFIVCMSDNPDKVSYPNFNLFAGDLHRILSVEWYLTAKAPNIHETYSRKVEDLDDKYEVMQVQLDEIRKKLKLI
jgi:phage repressor protein C with HTH and peptisase S24 domain